MHETNAEAPAGDAPIQTVFSALVDDQRRTDQICADVHDAVAAGRTCLVLTQRKDHIDAIVARLAVLGDTALVLRGGLGKKARAAVAEAIATRSDGSGVVLVATGSCLGEGFDWPELNTLFLAFPVAFKGRVVQYVGRLLRTHDDKHNVELHDYVDVRIPVLERMHAKRLPAYSTLGFNVGKRRGRRWARLRTGVIFDSWIQAGAPSAPRLWDTPAAGISASNPDDADVGNLLVDEVGDADPRGKLILEQLDAGDDLARRARRPIRHPG